MQRKVNRGDARPTHTKLVYDQLAHWPTDFATVRELASATGSTYNQVSAALFHLRNRHAVDVVIERDGTGFWFATPGDDDRTKMLDERVPEDRPRKRRAPRILKTAGRPTTK